jgi:hypothetical protein
VLVRRCKLKGSKQASHGAPFTWIDERCNLTPPSICTAGQKTYLPNWADRVGQIGQKGPTGQIGLGARAKNHLDGLNCAAMAVDVHDSLACSSSNQAGAVGDIARQGRAHENVVLAHGLYLLEGRVHLQLELLLDGKLIAI